MIPTRYKSKLPGHLSYPIGAEVLSKALEGSPHAELLSVGFRENPLIFASDFQRLLSERQPYLLLRAEYKPAQRPGISASNDSVEKGWYDEKWELDVYPVLRPLRSLAHGLLLGTGLPAVAQWLWSSRRDGWSRRQQWLDLIFDSGAESIVAREGSRE